MASKSRGGRIAGKAASMPEAHRPKRRRAYEGALQSRLTANWITSSTSADAEIDGSLVRLRNRSRQLVRDSPYARQAIRAIGANVVGRGIRMQGRVRMQRGNRLNELINRRIESGWQIWCKHDRCHVAGRLSMAEILRLAITSAAESGEVFLRIIPEAFGRSRIPLGIEIIESDYCDEGKSYGRDANGNQWRMGVQVNRWGRPLKYAFRTTHPGDIVNGAGGRPIEVPADQIIHLFIPERPGQTRGAPWVASAIKRLHHLDGYEEAEVVRARANSSLMGFIQSPDGELQGDEVLDGDQVSRFEPGVFKYLAPGETVSIPQLDAPDGQFEPFLRGMLRSVAAAIGCSYETISRDFSQSNYSSSRLSLLEDREHWRILQDFMIEHLLQPIYERWLAAAVGSGQLLLPDYEAMPERYEAVQWYPRGWAWVDPQKEVDAYTKAVRAGFTTQAQVVAESSGDIEDLLIARANEVDRAEQLGLQFDTNPADDQQGGAPNATPEQQPDPTTEE